MKFTKTVMIKLASRINFELNKKLGELEKISNEMSPNLETKEREYDPKEIFIVHGRDMVAKEELYDILKNRLDLSPIVLMDKENQGKTVIEKFENHSINAGYAFVLLTPDDVGCLQKDIDGLTESKDIHDKLELRARENVILELGYFVGKLGRERVCCIQHGDDDLLPGDLDNLVTIRYYDSVKDKFLKIEDELRKANYSI